jgi:hypothetical protein
MEYVTTVRRGDEMTGEVNIGLDASELKAKTRWEKSDPGDHKGKCVIVEDGRWDRWRY